MRSIHSNSALLPLHVRLQHKHLLGTTKLPWLSTYEPIKLASHSQQFNLSLGTSCRAMHNYTAVVLGVTPPAKSGDISVLLQVGGVLLFAYVFSNFIVPSLISEYYGFNKLSEDDEDEDLK
uniref:uncharacterized protein LOC105350536 n=1 Tax=Fragaria vesca subsp. vesca TaxID=101020 RepID=UPI0005C878FE|nr:PREDICTED: uncharacterized protein LOC105350536 [Fragaria vesca subsp. vesca]